MKNKEDNEEELLDEEPELNQEPEVVTREINLDDLYDGVVNNTVVIDPITNDELLIKNKKPNYTLLGILILVSVLLVLYYVNNKTEIGGTTKQVAPKTTKEVKTTLPLEEKNGTLNCTYASKSDADTQTLTYVANYENEQITNSKFNYIVVSSTENLSAVVENLMGQYETFYINNVSVSGNNVTFEKNDKGFTFNSETNYSATNFDQIMIVNDQTVLYVKPAASDTIESLKEAYTSKGFTCTIISDEKTK